MHYEQNTQNIRSLVKNYTIMPGLVLATLGGYIAFTGAFNMLWDNWLYWLLFNSNPNSWLANLGAFGSSILPLVLYIVIIYAVIRYYKRNFGQVKPHAEEMCWLTFELVATFVAYFFIGQWLDIHLHSKVSITLLIFALFLFIHWWMFARTQKHYPLLAGIAVALSFVPLFNSTIYYWLYIKYTSPDWYGFNIAICSGLLLFIAGFLDHWHMTRMLARVRSQIVASSSLMPEATDMQTRMEEL
jgi:hypothetical protein